MGGHMILISDAFAVAALFQLAALLPAVDEEAVLCAYVARGHGGSGAAIQETYSPVTAASQARFAESNGGEAWEPCVQAKFSCDGKLAGHFNDAMDASAYYKPKFNDFKCFGNELCLAELQRAKELFTKEYAVEFGQPKCVRAD
jgi:hypothetical protein